MMSDRDLAKALDMVLLRTTDDSMSWTARSEGGKNELLGKGIAGYVIKITEAATRSYSIKIALEVPGASLPRVVGAVTEEYPRDPTVRSALEGKLFAIFREAYGRAQSEDFQAFAGAVQQGLRGTVPPHSPTDESAHSGFADIGGETYEIEF